MASADVPPKVVTSTIHLATLLAAGNAAGAISGPVAALTQGALKTMFLHKIMTTTAVVLARAWRPSPAGALRSGGPRNRASRRSGRK